ncbi:MAG TPA: glycosyl hydrolase family 28-related protein [Actinomycetota bacterium]|nr:glycosyl hydrolase family 28-related protein [Actinomycetota bacterium]
MNKVLDRLDAQVDRRSILRLAAVGTAGAAVALAHATPASAGLISGSEDPWINVKALGALGDGSTNDTSVIQDAIDSAPIGATVLIPDGTFSVGSLRLTKRIRLQGAGPGRTILKARPGSASPLVDVAFPGLTQFVDVSGMTFDVTGAGAITAMRVHAVSQSFFHELEVLGGSIGIDIESSGATVFRDLVIRNQSTAGIRLNGDDGLENYFENISIGRDQAGTTDSGFLLTRTTARDTGGVYMRQVRVNRWGGSISTGFRFVGSVPVGIFLFMDQCVADNIDGRASLLLENVANTRVMNSFFTAVNRRAIEISGGQDHTVMGNFIDGGPGGSCIAFDNSPIHITATSNRLNQGTALLLPGAGKPFGLALSHNNVEGATLTNDPSGLANAASNNDTTLGLQVLVNPTDGRLQTFSIKDAVGGSTKSFRVSDGALEIMNNDFDAPVMSISDDGDVRAHGSLTIGAGHAISGHLSGTTKWRPGTVANGTARTSQVAVAGAVAGDTVAIGFSQPIPPGVLISGAVSQAGVVGVTLLNMTGRSVVVRAGVLRADVWKH